MNEDFYIELPAAWHEYLYFEPDYDPNAYLACYDDEQDGEWVDE
jgi:hypothetical protein